MFIDAQDMQRQTRPYEAGGLGETTFVHIAQPEQLPKNARLLSEFRIEKGSSVGKHVHAHEANVYYCLAGRGRLDDNGTIVQMRKGDASICRGGDYHAISNEHDEVLRVVAMVIIE